jgi:hypothetical protein
VTQFHSQKQAKEYLIGRIVAEAGREGIVLSEVERKMLYFSETDWTLPGILDVNAEFERDYDNEEYEEKIDALVRDLQASATAEEHETWNDAVQKLGEGDHYLLFLIDGTGASGGIPDKLGPWLPSAKAPKTRPRGDLPRLILIAILACLVALLLFAVRERFR